MAPRAPCALSARLRLATRCTPSRALRLLPRTFRGRVRVAVAVIGSLRAEYSGEEGNRCDEGDDLHKWIAGTRCPRRRLGDAVYPDDEVCVFTFCRNGTSMISLIIPPKDQISRVSKMLADEFGTASNIKSRVNRLSVLGAITSVQHRLKLYTKGNLCFLARLKSYYLFV